MASSKIKNPLRIETRDVTFEYRDYGMWRVVSNVTGVKKIIGICSMHHRIATTDDEYYRIDDWTESNWVTRPTTDTPVTFSCSVLVGGVNACLFSRIAAGAWHDKHDKNH